MLCGVFIVIENRLTDIVRTIILLTLLQKCAFSQLRVESQCSFPESEQQPFFFDVSDLEPIGTVIVDTVVKPPDARLSIGSIRSRNITTIDFNNRFTLRTDQNHFSLLLNDSLKLPPFPSIIRETYLYVTIICNQQTYPLITIRVTHSNAAAPQFYGRQPYSIELNKATAPGTLIETPVLAIDWDPSATYSVSYDIVGGNEDDYFALDRSSVKIHKLDTLPIGFNEDFWNLNQLPTIVYLIVQKKLDLNNSVQSLTLNISANDNDEIHPLSNYTTLKIRLVEADDLSPVFSLSEYQEKFSKSMDSEAELNEPIEVPDDETSLNSSVEFPLEENDFSSDLKINKASGQIELTKVASLADPLKKRIVEISDVDNLSGSTTTIVYLHQKNEKQTSIMPSFEKCDYNVSVSEDAVVGTQVLRLEVVDTPEDDVGIQLSDDSGMFTIDSKSGAISIAKNDEFYMKLNNTFAIFATFEKTSNEEYKNMGVCQNATIRVTIQEANGSSSRSDKDFYKVILPKEIQNGSVIGSIEAKNTDQGLIKLIKPHQSINDSYEHGQLANSTSENDDQEAMGIALAFEQPTYRFGIYELDDFIGNVRTSNRSSDDTRTVYSLVEDAKAYFKIDERSGDIKIRNRSAIVNEKEINFHVIATDLSNKNFTATALVSVIIDSALAADLPPRFESRYYNITIAENAQPQRIGILQAYHPLAGENNRIVYNIPHSADSGFFAIDTNSGVLHSLESFDYEEKNFYQFQVLACLQKNRTFCGFCNVTVAISDENDNSPEFEQSSFSVDLPIDTPVGTEVAHLLASDKDSGSNADISYTLKTPSGIFALDDQSGILSTVIPLSEAKKYHLVVEAFDHGYPTHRQTADVFISVQDSNPSAPEFDQFRYDVIKVSPVPAGSVLVTLHAEDPDPGPAGQIEYRFATAEDPRAAANLSKFIINPKTGQLSTKVRLTSEDSSPLHFVVEAVDQSPTFPRKTQTVVRINILSSAVEQVSFLPLPKRVYISTSKAPGSVILKVSATRTVAPPVFSMKEEDDLNYFEMFGDELRVQRKLTEGSVNVTIRVDAGSSFAEHLLNVVIMADRDKYPVFPHLTYNVQVPLNATFPLLVHQFEAGLTRGTVVYGTYPTDSLPIGLRLDEATGDLYASKEFVDAFYGKPTVFTIIRARNAEDPQYYSDVGVALSVSSDEGGLSFPVKLYRLVLRENSPAGTVLNPAITVGNHAAYDDVKYELRPSDLFWIDGDGVVRSRQSIDAEKLRPGSKGIIEMTVIASNGEEEANATVQIKIEDVNEYAPKFDSPLYDVEVPENIEPGHMIVQVHAFDRDISEQDRLAYKIQQGDEQSLMWIAKNGSIFKSNSGYFDRETTKVLNITVVAIDNDGNSAETTVRIHVNDVNDNEPKINGPLIWNVTEGVKGVGSKFIISANDADADQNGVVSFNIIQGNGNHSFNLKSLPGNKAELSVIRELDREASPRHLLTIEARDHGSPPLFSVATIVVNILDENDSPPFFIQDDYKQNVPLDLPVDFPLLTVRAADEDLNSKLIYSIRSDPSKMFSINKDTGAISFSSPVADRVAGHYEIEVDVSDGVHVSTVIVAVGVYDTNDDDNRIASTVTPAALNRAPTFLRDSYEFSVNEGVIGPIGEVKFSDPDNDDLILTVEPKSYRNLFAVDSKNGTIEVVKALNYSMERERYVFLVVATDKGKPSSSAFANVIVTVVDVNDHAPQFDRKDYSAIVPSSISAPYTIPLGMVVEDDDFGENAKIRFSLKGADADCFSIDASLGSLTLTCLTDYAMKANYTLKIVATDRDGDGLSSEAEVSIFVAKPVTLPATPALRKSDANRTEIDSSVDEICFVTLLHSADEVTLQLNRRLDEPIYTLETKCDCEQLCRPVFSIVDPTLETYFSISPNGQLRLIKKLNVSELKSKHLLNNFGKLTIPIEVRTGEDSASEMKLVVLLREEVPPDNKIPTEVAVTSSDWSKMSVTKEQNSGLSRSDKSTDFLEVPIDIDAISGTTETSAFDSLDVEGSLANGVLIPTPLISNKSVNHQPTFPYEFYTSLMPEGRYGNGAVLSLKPTEIRAEDVDEGEEGFITYHIESERPNVPFFIRNTTGELIIFGNIDREETSEYVFDVVASDHGNPPLYGRTRVEVKILDVNDNYPEFVDAPIVVSLLENSPSGTVVATLHARDADDGRFGEVQYSLLDHEDTFAIDSKSGVITTKTQLSMEENDVYDLRIVASDLGRPALKTTHELRVEIFSSTNRAPQFRRSTYSANVASDAIAGQKITQVIAGPSGLTYSLDDSFSGLFEISNDGVISLGRVPIKSEQNRYHFMNVTATNDGGQIATTTLSIFLEGEKIVAVATTSAPPDGPLAPCQFVSKLYNAEIHENLPGRHKLTKVVSNCEKEGRPIEYIIAQGSMEFEVNPKTGELFVVGPLDREKRSLHFIIVNVTEIGNNSDAIRPTRQTNPVIEHTKSKLDPWQTLVAVHVLDENDNEPHFVKLNSEGIYVFSVDWQAPVLTPVGRVHAEDADGRVPLTYWIPESSASSADHFRLNMTSGVIALSKSLITDRNDVYEFEVVVSDGVHNVSTIVKIYRLAPESNIVLLSADIPQQDIEEWVVERKMSDLTDEDVRVLVKQAYVNEEGQVNPQRSHLFVYALDKKTHVPIARDQLKTILEQSRSELDGDLPKLAIALPAVDSTGRVSVAELMLIIICVILLFIACCMLLYLARYCKRKAEERFNGEYMVDSQTAGPRPYDVEQIDRKTAQTVLSSRAPSYPHEMNETYNINLRASPPIGGSPSPDLRHASGRPLNMPLNRRQSNDAYGTIGPRSKNFSGDVMHVHSLISNRTGKDVTSSSALQTSKEDELFPVYRSQGYWS